MAKTLKVKAAKAYTADSLRSLGFPDNVREKIGMYFGSAEEAGVRRGWKEIVDNSIDELQNGHGKRIVVMYETKKRMFTVYDDGRGVPSGWNKKEKKSGFEIVFTTLHGSGKHADSDSYAESVGINGVGAAVTQGTSSTFQAWSANEGTWKTQKFAKGKAISQVVKGVPDFDFVKGKRGSVIQWVPDPYVFKDSVIDVDRMRETCDQLAMLTPGIEITLIIDKKTKVYKSEHGLLDMIYRSDEQKQLALVKPFQYKKVGLIDIAVVWQDDDLQQTWSYVNSSHTPEEGTHVQGARNVLLEALRAEVDAKSKVEKKPAKRGRGKSKADDGTLDAKYLLMGIRIALNWKIKNPVYASQTKDKLTNSEVITQIKNIVLPEFSQFLKKNPKLVATLIDRAKKFQKASEKFHNDLKAVKSISLSAPGTRGLLPGKLAQARGRYKPEQIELFLVEGDSASGPAKEVRLPWQEVLALKGKILNASRTDLAKILSSEEVMNIITATGARPGDDCKIKGGSVRIGKIIIMTDADSDGGHICSLLISLFSKYFRPWLDALMIGYIKLPLFVGAIGDKKEFGFTLDEMLGKWPEAKRKSVIVNRLKGLGEMTNTELLTYGMDPETRRIQMLEFKDADVAEIERVMGDDVAYRKEFLGIAPAPVKVGSSKSPKGVKSKIKITVPAKRVLKLVKSQKKGAK